MSGLERTGGVEFVIKSMKDMVSKVMASEAYPESIKELNLEGKSSAALMLNLIVAHMKLTGASVDEMYVTSSLLATAFNEIRDERKIKGTPDA